MTFARASASAITALLLLLAVASLGVLAGAGGLSAWANRFVRVAYRACACCACAADQAVQPVALALAFSMSIPGGEYIVSLALAIFAFTTILGWSFYGEKCVQFLFGVKAILPFRILWVLALPIGATQSLEFIWLLADTLNAMMAIPNLIALALLSPVVFRLTKAYFADQKAQALNSKV